MAVMLAPETQTVAVGLLSRRPCGLEHNGAAFMAYRVGARAGTGEDMRLIFGIIIGCALTVGGAYIVDAMSPPAAGSKMVNWDVVSKNLDTVTTLAREGWKKIVG
jgi:hypothetical protein